MIVRLPALAIAVLVALPAWAQITGYVYSSDGQPLPNIVVRAQRDESSDELRERIAAGVERKTLAAAATDAKGRFSLDPKVSGVVVLAIATAGYTPEERRELATEKDVVFLLSKITTARRRLTSNGKPLANATVIVNGFSGATFGRTDERGELSLPLHGARLVTLFHPDRGAVTWESSELPAGDLEMSAAPAAGRVLLANGRPAAGARILVDGWPVGRSGNDGSFSFPLIATAARELQAVLGNERGAVLRTSPDLTIRLAPQRVMTGIVRDPKQRPLPGVFIRASADEFASDTSASDPALHTGNAVSDDRGRFRMFVEEADGDYVSAAEVSNLTFQTESELESKGHVELSSTYIPFIRGVVVDEERRPIAGATVIVNNTEHAVYSRTLHAPSAVTVADGSFRIRVLETFGDQVRLMAMHRDRAAAGTDVVATSSAEKVTIVMPKGVPVTGVVTDREGRPIDGASVFAFEHFAERPAGAVLAASTQLEPWLRTTAGGTFTLHLRQKPHDVVVRAGGHQNKLVSVVEIAPAMDALRIILDPGVVLSGRVVRKGRLTERETLIVAESGAEEFRHEAAVATDGTFSFNTLPAGTYKLTVGSRSHVARAPASGVVIELAPRIELRGRVTDKETGEPITTFSVTAVEDGDDSMSTGSQFEHGNGEFSQTVTGERLAVYAEAPGYLRSDSESVVFDPEKPAELRFALKRGRTVRGLITDESGTAIEGASIQLESTDSGGDSDASDEKGNFEILGVSSAAMSLVATKEGFTTTRTSVDEGDSHVRVDLVLRKGHTISGRVVKEDGSAAEDIYVEASSAVRDAGEQDTRSGADGTFTIAGLADTPYEVAARSSEHGSAIVKNVDPAKSHPLLLTLGGRAEGRVVGTVSGFDGPPSGQVIIGTQAQTSASGEIDSDGRFTIDEVPAGRVTVRAIVNSTTTSQRVSRAAAVVVPRGGEVSVDLAFEPGIAVQGRVTRNGGPAILADVSFQLLGSSGAWRAVTGDDGTYEVTGLERGVYEITATGVDEGGYSIRRAIESSTTIDMAVDPKFIEGRVVDSEGEPLAGVEVGITMHDVPVQSVTTTTSGTFRVAVRSGATYRVLTVKSGYAATATDAQAGDEPLVLRMTRTDGIRVRVVDRITGATMDGWAEARDDAGRLVARAWRLSPDGTLNLPLARGSYHVSGSALGYASKSVRVTAPSTSEVRIALAEGGGVVIEGPADLSATIRFILPTGETYAHCLCDGQTELRATGSWTRITSVDAGSYTMQLLDASGGKMRSYPIVVVENQITIVKVD